MATITPTRSKQIVVPIENRPGTLGEVTRILADAQVNILGIGLETTREFGIARLIVNEPAKAEQALRTGGFRFRTTEILTVHLPNKPGTIADITERLGRSGVNVEGVFGYTPTNATEGEVAFQVSDIASAEKTLRA